MQNNQNPPARSPDPKQPASCLSLVILVGLTGWIAGISFLRHFASISSTINPGPESKLTGLYGALIALFLFSIPLIPLSIFWPNLRYRAIFKTWLIASGLILFYFPVYIPDPSSAQMQSILHIFISIGFIGMLLFLARNRAKHHQHTLTDPNGIPADNIAAQKNWNTTAWLLALMISSISAYPWLAWGAFGSLLDTTLQFIFAWALGLASILLIEIFIFQPIRQHPSSVREDYFIGGLGAGTTFLIMASATAFGYGSMQAILMIILPGLGWSLVSLNLLSPASKLAPDTQINGKIISIKNILPYSALISLVSAAPMTLIDPDELLLVLMNESGEIIGKAFQAALLSMFIGLAFAFVLLLLLIFRHSRPPEGIASPSRFNWTSTTLGTTTLAALGIAFLIYFYSGQPGTYGERMFVIFEDQADLSMIEEIPDALERRKQVYNILTEHAENSQADIRGQLDRFGIDYTPYYLVNALEVEANPFLRLWLNTMPEVDRILDSPRLRPLPNIPSPSGGYAQPPALPRWNLTQIGADRVWEEFNVRGKDIVIGQSDSGVQVDHPELVGSYRGANGNHDYNWLDPWYNTTVPTDFGGHGTHTLGSILGENIGVAPDAVWYACVNLGRNLANPALYLDCMQFMLAPTPIGGDPFIDGDPDRGAHVINNSWGCPPIEGCDTGTFQDAMKALRMAGVFIVASAGNDGPTCASLTSPPPIYDEAFSVGAIDRYGNLAHFSSIGPAAVDGTELIKPDIVAPGVEIVSSLPGNAYGTSSGTSMAGPHVAGVVALMWSANPQLIGDIDRTEDILRQTARPYTNFLPDCPGAKDTPSTAVGYGIVDAYAAVQMALQEAE